MLSIARRADILPRLLATSCLLLASSCTPAQSDRATTPPASPPPTPWLQYADARQAGFDPAALKAVCDHADQLQSGAVMAVFSGRVILACGDVARPLEAHSVRKSLVSGLYGTAVARGEIDLDASLADLTIDDLEPLSAAERSATVRQVISARSGVYHPAAYAPAGQSRRPARGTHAPGTHWFYNNWDFNVAGVIYERATHEDLYESFGRRLAGPLGMEDWDAADGFRVFEPTKSRHAAHTFRISTRDLARFGQLYLQEGRWAGQALLPIDWIKDSTTPHTDDGDGTGYGYMWWLYQAGSPVTARYPHLGQHRFFLGLGTGGQGLWIIPQANMVIVHRADTDHGRSVDGEEHWSLVERILAARRREPDPSANLHPLRPLALSSQLPALVVPEDRMLPGHVIDDYLGDYRLTPGASMRIASYDLHPGAEVRFFLFDGKPYIHVQDVGDAQLFPHTTDTFTLRALPGLQIAFVRGPDGAVTALTLTLRDRQVTALRTAQPR